MSVLLNKVTDEREAANCAQRILDTLAAPLEVNGHKVSPAGSIGIALSKGSITAGDLLRNADIAMYEAKTHKDGFSVFNAGMHGRMLRIWKLQAGLAKAVSRGELLLHYQPLVSMGTHHIEGSEALVRWKRSDGELVPPADFIPQAEEMGLIGEIGKWVLRTACEQQARWQQLGYEHLKVSGECLGSPTQRAELQRHCLGNLGRNEFARKLFGIGGYRELPRRG